MDTVCKRRTPTGSFDLDNVTVGEFPIARRIAQQTCPKEVQMYVARLTMLRELEVMVFEVRQGVAHMFFAAEERATVVKLLFPSRDRAAQRDLLEIPIGVEFRSNRASSQF